LPEDILFPLEKNPGGCQGTLWLLGAVAATTAAFQSAWRGSPSKMTDRTMVCQPNLLKLSGETPKKLINSDVNLGSDFECEWYHIPYVSACRVWDLDLVFKQGTLDLHSASCIHQQENL
jgi:hypothetical protein